MHDVQTWYVIIIVCVHIARKNEKKYYYFKFFIYSKITTLQIGLLTLNPPPTKRGVEWTDEPGETELRPSEPVSLSLSLILH